MFHQMLSPCGAVMSEVLSMKQVSPCLPRSQRPLHWIPLLRSLGRDSARVSLLRIRDGDTEAPMASMLNVLCESEACSPVQFVIELITMVSQVPELGQTGGRFTHLQGTVYIAISNPFSPHSLLSPSPSPSPSPSLSPSHNVSAESFERCLNKTCQRLPEPQACHLLFRFFEEVCRVQTLKEYDGAVAFLQNIRIRESLDAMHDEFDENVDDGAVHLCLRRLLRFVTVSPAYLHIDYGHDDTLKRWWALVRSAAFESRLGCFAESVLARNLHYHAQALVQKPTLHLMIDRYLQCPLFATSTMANIWRKV